MEAISGDVMPTEIIIEIVCRSMQAEAGALDVARHVIHRILNARCMEFHDVASTICRPVPTSNNARTAFASQPVTWPAMPARPSAEVFTRDTRMAMPNEFVDRMAITMEGRVSVAAADEYTLRDDGTAATRREHVEMSRYPRAGHGRLCGPGLLINPGGGTQTRVQGFLLMCVKTVHGSPRHSSRTGACCVIRHMFFSRTFIEPQGLWPCVRGWLWGSTVGL